MPTLNQKLFLRLIAVVVVLGGGLAVLHYVQARRVPEALLWQANAAAEKGKTDKAIAYMQQYLEFRSDDHDTAVKLADLMVERAVSSKDLSNAHFLYERVLREAGVTQEEIQAAVRIAAVVNAVAVTLETESAAAVQPIPAAA